MNADSRLADMRSFAFNYNYFSCFNMKFEEWEPIYKLILEDMHFDRIYDENSARLLSKMLETKARKKPPDVIEIEFLQKAINGKDVLVCGKAPCLKDDIKKN